MINNLYYQINSIIYVLNSLYEHLLDESDNAVDYLSYLCNKLNNFICEEDCEEYNVLFVRYFLLPFIILFCYVYNNF